MGFFNASIIAGSLLDFLIALSVCLLLRSIAVYSVSLKDVKHLRNSVVAIPHIHCWPLMLLTVARVSPNEPVPRLLMLGTHGKEPPIIPSGV